MKKKWMKILCLVLTCSMLLASLAGCGSSSSSSGDAESADGDSASSDEITEITMLWPYVITPDDLEMVVEAINEITEAEIGVHVNVSSVSLMETESEITRMAAAGEDVDLYSVIGVSSYVNSGLCAPLEDLIEEYGESITEVLGVLTSAYEYDGHIYTIPSSDSYASSYGIILRQDILDKYGLSLEEGETMDYETLDEWFAIIKEGEGSDFYMFATVGSSSSSEEPMKALCNVDTLGGEFYTGVFTDYDSDDYTVENFYESEVFEEYVTWMHKWYEAGYINPDSATMEEASAELMLTGNYLGYIGGVAANTAASTTNDFGYEMVTYTFEGNPVVTASTFSNGWCISSTSDNQEACMKLLNLMFSSTELANLMAYGIEGVHYVTTDEENIIDYPDGVDGTTVTYSGPIAGYGDMSSIYQMAPMTSELIEEMAESNQKAAEGSEDYDYSKAYGYVFVQTEVKTEIAALADVIAEYRGVYLYGSQDPEETIAALNEALYAAGLSTVLEENQSQIDAWLAEQ